MTAKQFSEFLERHGWTGYQFHKITGISKPTVYRWLDKGIASRAEQLLFGYIDKNPKHLKKIVEALTVNE